MVPSTEVQAVARDLRTTATTHVRHFLEPPVMKLSIASNLLRGPDGASQKRRLNLPPHGGIT